MRTTEETSSSSEAARAGSVPIASATSATCAPMPVTQIGETETKCLSHRGALIESRACNHAIRLRAFDTMGALSRRVDAAASLSHPLRSAKLSVPARPRRVVQGVEMLTKNPSRQARPTFTDQEALLFHSQGRPGKLEVIATKPMATQRDLSLAYSPGVAVPVLAIAEDESRAYDYTTKGNFVAVITNGTAILGLGNRGALAAKPVMEGKAVLFKRFADIDSIDLEVNTEDPDEFINCVKIPRQGLGRHQPRRHQGAGVLHHRAAAARAARHSGVPRRPARHRDHRGGRA